MSVLVWTELVTCLWGRTLTCLRAPLPDWSPVLSTALGVYIDHFFFSWRTFVSQKGKHVSKLAWGPVAEWWVSVGWFALETLSTPASSVVAPDWTSPSWSEPGIQLTNGVWKEIPSFLVCVVTSLFYVFTFTYPNDMFFSPDVTVNYQPLLVQSSMKDILGTCTLKKEPLFS